MAYKRLMITKKKSLGYDDFQLALDDFIKLLKKNKDDFEKEGYKEILIEIPYEDIDSHLVLYSQRLENDEEYKTRTAKLRMKVKQKKQKKEAEDREIYEQLKKKFEKVGD